MSTQNADDERARLEAAMPVGDYYECLTCDDGWDFVGEPPFYCLHCGARIDGSLRSESEGGLADA